MTDLRNLIQSVLSLYGFGAPPHRKRPEPVQIGRSGLGLPN